MRACETSAAAIAIVLGMMLAFPKGAESFCFETGGRSAVTASTADVKGAGFGLSGGGGGGGSPGMAASSRRDCRLSDHQNLSMGSLDDISTDGEKETLSSSSSAAAAAAAAAAAEHPKPGESASTLKSNGAPSSSTSFSGAGASYLENLMPSSPSSSSSSPSPPEDTRRNFFSNGASDKFSFSRGEKENIVKERERKAVSKSAASTPPPSLENGVAAAAAKRNRLPAGDGDDDDGAIGERMFLPRPPSVPPPPSSYMSKVPPAPASSHRGSAASWSQEQKPPDSSERNARASSSFSSSKGRTNPSESDLERLKESMPEPSVVKSALSSFSSYMESISSQFADKFSMSKERSVEVDDLIQKARTAATMPKAKGKVAEDDGGGVGQRPRASARASPQSEWIVPPSRPSGSASVPLPKTTTKTKPIPAAVRSQASRDEFSTVPKYRALVPINDSTIEFTSGLIGGIVGLAIGGPVAGAVAAAAANYVSKREEEVGDVVRAVSKSAMQCYNYLVNLDAKYRALETARESLGAAYDGIRTDRNADPLFVKRIERALRKTSERLVEMNDEYDLVDTGLVALGVIGDLVEIAVTKVDELNREYKLTDRAWSAVTRRGTSSVRKLPPGRND